VVLAQRGLDVCGGVCLAGGGHDACVRKERVRGQRLEERDGAVEEDGHFLRGLVVGVAGGVEGRDACAVLAPFVLPEGLVVTLVVFPVLLHVAQGLIGTGGLKNLRDVGISAFGVAVRFVCAIAVVGPQAVNSP
jgi:hypothetical protein